MDNHHVIFEILSWLNWHELVCVSPVNRMWNEVASCNALWEKYCSLYKYWEGFYSQYMKNQNETEGRWKRWFQAMFARKDAEKYLPLPMLPHQYMELVIEIGERVTHVYQYG